MWQVLVVVSLFVSYGAAQGERAEGDVGSDAIECGSAGVEPTGECGDRSDFPVLVVAHLTDWLEDPCAVAELGHAEFGRADLHHLLRRAGELSLLVHSREQFRGDRCNRGRRLRARHCVELPDPRVHQTHRSIHSDDPGWLRRHAGQLYQ